MAKQGVNFDAKDLIHAIQTFFAGIARTPEKKRDFDPKFTKYNVEVRVGRNRKEGILKVKFFTESRFLVEFEMEASEMFKDHKSYLDGVMLDITKVVSEGKRKRAQEKPIILLH